jgi:arginyl-tRNA synthetase
MLAEHKQRITSLVAQAVAGLGAIDVPIVIERPKVAEHGDAATSVAMQLAKSLKKNPREVATAIADALKLNPAARGLIEGIEVAGPGFINLRLAASAKHEVIRLVLRERECFGTSSEHAGEKVMVEFVSANPTGPLHLGHARQAALGDALANLLAALGYAVTREFYYNDAGVQIDTLARSVQARAKQLKGTIGEGVEFPADGYQGDYIADIAREFIEKKTETARDGSPVHASGDVNDFDNIRHFAVAYLRHEQDTDLAALGLQFDNFYLESSLYADSRVERAVKAMVDSGLTYEAEGALWLKTTEIGNIAGFGGPPSDDKDRVMRKQDGAYTYFVPDVAYHLAKWERGYSKVINVQGSDHYGTVARVRAGVQAASRAMGVAIPRGYPDYVLHKMLKVNKGGEEVKMSKRAGSYVTLHDLLDWVGPDATRFFLVSRKADTEFTFDVDLALSQSEDNPVYYVQYAHARICSVLREAGERYAAFDPAKAQSIDLAPLSSPKALALASTLAAYPETLRASAGDLAPHQVCFYLKDLAADFHAFYNAERVLVDDAPAREARLALLAATRHVLRNGLRLLGVGAPERM